MSNRGVPRTSTACLLREALGVLRRLTSWSASFYGVCFSFGLHWCSSDLSILGWHFGHKGNHHEAHHAARSKEKKAVGNCQGKSLLTNLQPQNFCGATCGGYASCIWNKCMLKAEKSRIGKAISKLDIQPKHV